MKSRRGFRRSKKSPEADTFTVITIYRDGETISVGLSRKQAGEYLAEMIAAYPDSNFSTVPGGFAKPGNTGDTK